jgi:hypothetical protein
MIQLPRAMRLKPDDQRAHHRPFGKSRAFYPNGGGSPVLGCRGCARTRIIKITSRDLGVFVDQAAEPVPSQDPDIGARDARMLAPAGLASCY